MKTKKELKDEVILKQLLASWLAYLNMMEFKTLIQLEMHRMIHARKIQIYRKKQKNKHCHARLGFFAHHQRENFEEIKPKFGL